MNVREENHLNTNSINRKQNKTSAGNNGRVNPNNGSVKPNNGRVGNNKNNNNSKTIKAYIKLSKTKSGNNTAWATLNPDGIHMKTQNEVYKVSLSKNNKLSENQIKNFPV